MRRFYFPLYVCFTCTFIIAINTNNKTNNTFTVPIIDTVAQAINTKNNTEKISPTEELKSLQNNVDTNPIVEENDRKYNENKDRQNTETQEYNSLQQELSEESPVFYAYKTSTSDNLAALVEKLESLNQKSASLFFRENKLKSWHQEIAEIIYYVRIINKKEHNKRLEQEAYKPLHAALKELTQTLVTYEPLIIIPDITKILQESPYAILGIEKNATDEEIVAAYQNFYQQYTAEKIQQRMQQEHASEKDIKREKKAGAIVLATIQQAYDKIKTEADRAAYTSQEAEEYSDQLSTESKNALQKITATLGRLLYSGQLLTQIEKFIKEYEPQELEKKKALTKSELERIGEEKIRLQQRPTFSQTSHSRDYGYGSGSDYYSGSDYGNYGGGSYGGNYGGYDPYSLTQPVSGGSDMGGKGGGGPLGGPNSSAGAQSDKDKEKADKDKKAQENASRVDTKKEDDIKKTFKQISTAHTNLESALSGLKDAIQIRESLRITKEQLKTKSGIKAGEVPPPPVPEAISPAEIDAKTAVDKAHTDVKDEAKKLIEAYNKLHEDLPSSTERIVDIPGVKTQTFTATDMQNYRQHINNQSSRVANAIQILSTPEHQKFARRLREAFNKVRESLHMQPLKEQESDGKNTPAEPITINQAEASSIKNLRDFEQAHTTLEDALDNLETASEIRKKMPLDQQSSIKILKANKAIREQETQFTQKAAELVEIYDGLNTKPTQKEIALYKKVMKKFESTIKLIIEKLPDFEKLPDDKNTKPLAQQLITAIDTFRKILGMGSILAPKEETDSQEDGVTTQEQE